MRQRSHSLLLAILLGGIIPVLLLVTFQKGKQNIPDIAPSETMVNTQPTTTQPTESQYIPVQALQIPVLMSNGEITQMDLSSYLTAVVLKEMPASFEMEALKAQAVVARTYALRQCTAGSKHTGGAVCVNSACCQGFCTPEDYLVSGGEQAMLDRIRDAILDTENQVLVYDGKLIDATYFSCSGGKTEDAKAVWGTDIPYLQSVESPGEESATNYVNTVQYSLDTFSALLGIEKINSLEEWIGSITYTEGGGVDTIEICGIPYKGTKLREILGLRSTAFTITAIGDRVTITTKGFGHRVGMSQYGAEAMAVQGSTYEEILSYYYQGAMLVDY